MKLSEQHQQILSYANENPSCYLATVENEQPRVRGMQMWFADETGFYFHTASVKNLAKQLIDNPKAEIAFQKPSSDLSDLTALRVSGKVEILYDAELEKRLYTERPWLHQLTDGRDDVLLVIFKIANGEAYIWDMRYNLNEEAIPVCEI